MPRNWWTVLTKSLLLASVACHAPTKPLTFRPPATEPTAEVLWDEPGDPYLAEFRARYDLERLRRTGDLETVRAVSAWAHSLWKHNGRNTPRKSDPLSILAEVETGKRFRCVEYAIVMKGALSALGVPARVVGLMRRNVETRIAGAGHVVVEVYLRERASWVMVDPQWNAIPFDGDAPLSAVALQERIALRAPGLRYEGLPRRTFGQYTSWIEPYLFFFQIRLDNRTQPPRPVPGSFVLVPDGVDAPRVFERRQPIDATAIRSVAAFYPVVDGPGTPGP